MAARDGQGGRAQGAAIEGDAEREALRPQFEIGDAQPCRGAEAVAKRAGMGSAETVGGGIVSAEDHSAARAPDGCGEAGFERAEAAEVVEVVGLDVGDDEHGRRVVRQGAVALVGLDDQRPAAGTVRHTPHGRRAAADAPLGSGAQRLEQVQCEAGGGGLAVGAADGDAGAFGDQRRQHHAAACNGDAEFPGAEDFRIIIRHGRAVDQQVAAGVQVSGGVVRRDGNALATEEAGQFARGVAVAARYLPAALLQQERDAGQTDTADAHGMCAPSRLEVQELPDLFVCCPVIHLLCRRFE